MTDPASDETVDLPPNASLSPPNNTALAFSLETSVGSIPISLQTSIRPKARCLLVGRQAKTVDIRVDHGSISRRHAALYFLPDVEGCVLQDLGSKKGTSVNGKLVEKGGRQVLHPGDEIVFGHARERTFQFTCTKVDPTKAEAQAAAAAAAPDNDDGQDQEALLIEKIIDQYKLPVRERMSLAAESERRSRVTSLALDMAGNRLAVGTTDGTLRLYDFGGMDRVQRGPFKVLQVEDDGQQNVADVCFSNTGDRILVGTGGSQPYVLDRDGGEIIKFVRGDMYVVDKAKTTGHTATVTGVQWHPLERDIVLTSSLDGSVRLWNLNGKTQFSMLVCDKVFQPKSKTGTRTTVQCLAFHPGGREFAVGTSCGSIQIWSTARISGRPERAVFDAHGSGKSVDAVVYNLDGSRLSSRSTEDSSSLVWQATKLSKSATPIATCINTPTLFAGQCRPAFSPDGKLLCVGISKLVKTTSEDGGKKEVEVGSIKLFQLPPKSSSSQSTSTPPTLDAILELPISVGGSGVTDILWHSKTNQLFLGGSDGTVEILFDQELSDRGALLPFARAGRPKEKLSELLKSRAPMGSAALVGGGGGQIIAPAAMTQGKRKRKGDDEDPAETLKPQAPGAKFRMGRLNNT